MASATSQVARTQGTSLYSKYFNLSATPYMARDPLVTAPFTTEHLEVQQVTGNAQPGGQVTYELPYEVDIVKSLNLQLVVDQMNLNGTATFARLSDFFGLNIISEILFRFGTERLQVVRAEELFEKMHFLFADEERSKGRQICGGALTPAQRSNRAQRGPQRFVIPLWTLLGVYLGGDPSQILPVRSMSERFRVQLTFTAANQLVESDGTWSFDVAAVLGQPPPAAGWFTASNLYVEGKHVFDSERRALERMSLGERRYLHREHQYCTAARIPGATLLNGGTVDVNMRELNQPVVSLYILFRWAADLDRIEGGAGGTRGRDLWNFGGWFNPAGAAGANGLPVISQLEGRAGSNVQWLRPTAVENLLGYEHCRAYKGSSVDGGAPAIPHVSFSHDPSQCNANLGFVDFSQMDNAILRITFNPDHGLASLNAAATADIGQNSDLDVLIIGDTLNQLNFVKHAVGRPYN